MRIRTAGTRRAIDRWKVRAKLHVRSSQDRALDFVSRLLVPPQRGKAVFIPPLVLALSLNFAAVELATIILVGFFIAKLQCYRFANGVMCLLGAGP